MLLDHQLQGLDLIFEKVSKVQLVLEQQMKFLRPAKVGDYLIGDVHQDLRREVLIIQFKRGTELDIRDGERRLIDQTSHGCYWRRGRPGSVNAYWSR
jgi:hypothetical protein